VYVDDRAEFCQTVKDASELMAERAAEGLGLVDATDKARKAAIKFDMQSQKTVCSLVKRGLLQSNRVYPTSRGFLVVLPNPGDPSQFSIMLMQKGDELPL
jgi:hypothetical protein